MSNENKQIVDVVVTPPGNHDDRRISAFRERAGNKFQDQLTQQLLDELQPHLAEKYFNLVECRESGTSTVVHLPMTTRGIGFNSYFSYSNYVEKVPRAATICPSSLPLYRISLLQLERQLARSHTSKLLGAPSDCDIVPPSRVNRNSLHNNVTHKNCPATGFSILQFGVCSYNGVDYRPYVPACKIERIDRAAAEADAAIAHNMALASALAAGNAQAGSAFRPVPPHNYVDLFHPDPFLVTFSNLRTTLEALSNPNTPQDWRTYFRKYNPIPGLTWSEDNLVINNINQIMPAEYTEIHLAEDNTRVEGLFSFIGRKDGKNYITMALEGIGRHTGLVGLAIDDTTRPYAVENIQDFVPFSPHVVRTIGPLPEAFPMMSVLALCSEIPAEVPMSDVWSIRSPWISSHAFNYSWFSLADNVLNSIY